MTWLSCWTSTSRNARSGSLNNRSTSSYRDSRSHGGRSPCANMHHYTPSSIRGNYGVYTHCNFMLSGLDHRIFDIHLFPFLSRAMAPWDLPCPDVPFSCVADWVYHVIWRCNILFFCFTVHTVSYRDKCKLFWERE